MNRKGFSLIEIIICIGLIAIITVSSIIGINVTKNNKVDKITNKILSAANVYLETEKDENGIKYINGIYKGGEGVIIPVKELVNTGYVTEKDFKKLSNSNAKVIAGFFSKEECESGISLQASWDKDVKSTMYFCNNNNKVNNIFTIKEISRVKVDLTKHAVSQEFYDAASEEEKQYLTPNENGIFIYNNEETDNVFYYYRGAVNNNYLKLGKDKDNKDLYWRILWWNDDNQMKIVLDNTIPMSITNMNGDIINVKDITAAYVFKQQYSSNPYYNYVINANFGTPEEKIKNGVNRTVYTVRVKNENRLSSGINFVTGTQGYYSNHMLSWFQNNTDLNSFDFIKENGYCNNGCFHRSTGGYFTYYQSDNFECSSGSLNYTTDKCSVSSSINNGSFGFLTYGDVVRAGFSKNNNNIDLSNSGNYLVEEDNVLLSDYNYNNDYRSAAMFYYSKNGVKSGEIYSSVNESSTRYLTLITENGSNLLEWEVGAQLFSDRSYYYSMYMSYSISYFLSNVLKPTLIIDTSDVTLSNSLGTKEEPFTIVDKK